MSAGRACHEISHRSHPTAEPDVARHRTRRNAAVVIADPHIVVVESATVVDPAVLDEALELLVRWSVRAYKRSHLVQPEAQSAKVDVPNGQAEPRTGQFDASNAQAQAEVKNAPADALSDQNSATYVRGN